MRNKLSWFPVVMTVLLGSAAALAFAPAGVEPPAAKPEPAPNTWKAVAASGLVEALPASQQTLEEWLRVERGDELEARTAVRTGRRGRATLIHGASIVLVDPNSRIALPASAAMAATNKVVQEYGSVLYEVDGSLNPDFRVVTPHLVAGVKGTVFMISVTDTHATVTVREGVVEVTSQRSGEVQEVHAGETMLVDAESTQATELISRDRRDRSKNKRDRSPDKGDTARDIERDREILRAARAEERRFDRAFNRLNADLADSGLLSGELDGFDDDMITAFLDGRDDRLDLIDSLDGDDSIVIQIGDPDDDDKEGLTEDLDDEEERKEQEDPGSVATPPQNPQQP